MKRLLALLAVVSLVLAASASALAQTPKDAHIGTWNLNGAESKFNPGPGYRSETRTYTPTADGYKFEGERVNLDGSTQKYGFTVKYDNKDYPVCMVCHRVASGKMSLAVGLRQCIRPLVESKTPGHDGHPLAFAPIKWTVSKDHFRNQVPKAWDRPIAISLRKQTGKELFF